MLRRSSHGWRAAKRRSYDAVIECGVTGRRSELRTQSLQRCTLYPLPSLARVCVLASPSRASPGAYTQASQPPSRIFATRNNTHIATSSTAANNATVPATMAFGIGASGALCNGVYGVTCRTGPDGSYTFLQAGLRSTLRASKQGSAECREYRQRAFSSALSHTWITTTRPLHCNSSLLMTSTSAA
jgi:hypothetical protein